MIYPFWDAGFSYGVLMAAIAVLHVFISHFAVGGGLYLVVTEGAMRRRGDAAGLAFVKRLSKFFILVTLVSGALTGVAIWFIIGLLNPAATEVLIHLFVWGWAIEWCFFFVEITAALLYYYGWQRMSARNHLILGWIYFIAAWLSLVIINGIITFMLTPGAWLKTGGFWTGFFNPTYWPSLVMRTGITVMMAGLVARGVSSRRGADGERPSGLVRYNAAWGLIGLGVASIAFFFWYLGAIPTDVMKTAHLRMAIPMAALDYLRIAGYVLGGLLLAAFLLPRVVIRPLALVLLATGFIWFGSFEWFRESMRKPYAIYGYSYANGLLVAKMDQYKKDGLLAHIPRTGDDGRDLYDRACASCHTIDRYNPMKPAFDGTDREFIAGVVKCAHALRGNMPPFAGTAKEAGLIADYVAQRVDLRPMEETSGLKGRELGALVYRKRCAVCHVTGGFQDVSKTLTGYDGIEDFKTMLDGSGDISDSMPAFSGNAAQGAALIDYLMSLKGASK